MPDRARKGKVGVRLALAAAAALGCAGKLPPSSAAGGPVWRRVESAHFRLRTDGDGDEARAALLDLETFRGALLAVFRAGGDGPPGQVPVIQLQHGWFAVASGQVEGYFLRALYQPLLVLRGGSDLQRAEAVKHELVHDLTRRMIAHQPLWLAEGLASYFQTLEYDRAQGRVIAGRPPPDLLRLVQRRPPLDAAAMMDAAVLPQGEASRFYASAWITVHYLMNHHARELEAYLGELSHGTAAATAWSHSFPGLDAGTLQQQVTTYLDGGNYGLLVFSFVPPQPEALDEVVLGDADAHAVRALLYLTAQSTFVADEPLSGEAPTPVREAALETDEALRADPTNLLASALRHWRLGPALDPARAKAIVDHHEGEWLAWWLYADALRRAGVAAGQQEAAETARYLARRDPTVQLTD